MLDGNEIYTYPIKPKSDLPDYYDMSILNMHNSIPIMPEIRFFFQKDQICDLAPGDHVLLGVKAITV